MRGSKRPRLEGYGLRTMGACFAREDPWHMLPDKEEDPREERKRFLEERKRFLERMGSLEGQLRRGVLLASYALPSDVEPEKEESGAFRSWQEELPKEQRYVRRTGWYVGMVSWKTGGYIRMPPWGKVTSCIFSPHAEKICIDRL